ERTISLAKKECWRNSVTLARPSNYRLLFVSIADTPTSTNMCTCGPTLGNLLLPHSVIEISESPQAG
ncbi:MAG: hypothetical protein RLZZ622_904, partial [Planctomycetota bacterium]